MKTPDPSTFPLTHWQVFDRDWKTSSIFCLQYYFKVPIKTKTKTTKAFKYPASMPLCPRDTTAALERSFKIFQSGVSPV